MSALDVFFNLGTKVTKGDPVRKAKFDYCLYWIVFIAFILLACQYLFNFFFKSAPFSTLCWAVIIMIFCWFNYFALSSFRNVYVSLKKAKERLSQAPEKIEGVDDMLKEFK